MANLSSFLSTLNKHFNAAINKIHSFCAFHNPKMSSFIASYFGATTFNWQEFVCGWGAAVINVSVTYPINKLIFRQVNIHLKFIRSIYVVFSRCSTVLKLEMHLVSLRMKGCTFYTGACCHRCVRSPYHCL